MPKSRQYKPLDLDSQARLFLQLAQTEKAGFSPVAAFDLMAKNDTVLAKQLKTLPARLKSGQKIAEAGFKAGLFDSNQYALVAAAESSGKLAELYKKLADYYNGAAKRRKKMLSRLYLPVFVLILSFFIQPFPALVTAKISFGEYLYVSAGQLLIMGVALTLLLKLPTILTQIGFSEQWHNVQLVLTPIANWLINRQLNTFFFMLAMQLNAGLAFSAALPQAIASIKNTALRKKFTPALNLMKTGASVYQTLATVPIIKAHTLQIINTGEHSGQLAETLLHFTEIDAETLALQDDSFAEWLPRLVYSAIALSMAYGILQQGLPLPQIPN